MVRKLMNQNSLANCPTKKAPILIWCFMAPFSVSSLNNHLGPLKMLFVVHLFWEEDKPGE
jgi:hypothetical protein